MMCVEGVETWLVCQSCICQFQDVGSGGGGLKAKPGGQGPSAPLDTAYILFFFFAAPHGIQDLSSLTRDQTHTLCIGNTGS